MTVKKTGVFIAHYSLHFLSKLSELNFKHTPCQKGGPDKTILAFTQEKQQFWFLTRSDTNWPVQSQRQARSLKFWIKEEERLYDLCSDSKGADQLCSYCTADLRLCFRIFKLLFFPMQRLIFQHQLR